MDSKTNASNINRILTEIKRSVAYQ